MFLKEVNMAEKKVIEHRVVLYVRKECRDRTMSDRQLAKWIRDRFVGSPYGSVRVADVMTEKNVSGEGE